MSHNTIIIKTDEMNRDILEATLQAGMVVILKNGWEHPFSTDWNDDFSELVGDCEVIPDGFDVDSTEYQETYEKWVKGIHNMINYYSNTTELSDYECIMEFVD